MMSAPILNPEIKVVLGATGIKKDQFQCITQNQLGAGLSALGKALSLLLDNSKLRDNNDVLNEITSVLGDAGKILTDLHHGISLTRRAIVISGRDPIIKTIADELNVDTTLFGQKFSERYKTAKEVEKVGKDLCKQPSKPNMKSTTRQEKTANYRSNNLNWKGQSGKKFSNPRRGAPETSRTQSSRTSSRPMRK